MNRSRLSFKTAWLVLLGMLLTLGACNMPGRVQEPTESAAGLIYTSAAMTVNAQLTQMSGVTTITPAPVTPFIPTTGIVVQPSNTLPALPTAIINTPQPPPATAVACDAAKFDRDVTIPDNTQVAPGETFVKIWRIQNVGSCTWDSRYRVVFAGGDSMGAPAEAPITSSTVAPGEKVDIAVTLKAPDTSGTYRADFRLRNASNVVFGLGNNNKPFWVQIRVSGPSGIMVDFIALANQAAWSSGVGNNASFPLAFNGPDDDPNGAAKIKQDVRLENNVLSGRLLLTFPRHETDGLVQGIFPAYTVQAGDRFKGRLGFLQNPEGGCGAGRVRFQLNYREGDAIRPFQEWFKVCDGKLIVVDLDLSSLRGKTVQFVFSVMADGNYIDDWAVWSSARIER